MFKQDALSKHHKLLIYIDIFQRSRHFVTGGGLVFGMDGRRNALQY
jgi:hypothetical protein